MVVYLVYLLSCMCASGIRETEYSPPSPVVLRLPLGVAEGSITPNVLHSRGNGGAYRMELCL